MFLLGHPGIAGDYWGGPQGIVQNAFQLSKLSGVSPPIANSWFNAMESSGYLRRIGRKKAILLRPNALIEEWRGKCRFGDNRILPYRSMYPVSEDDDERHRHGSRTAVHRVWRAALPQEENRADLADFSRDLGDVYHIYLLAGDRPEQILSRPGHGDP